MQNLVRRDYSKHIHTHTCMYPCIRVRTHTHTHTHRGTSTHEHTDYIQNLIYTQVIDSHKSQFERELLLKGDKLSDEEHKRLLAKFKQEQEAIERNLELERQRQNNSLADKVCVFGGACL